ncbi:MAG: VanZ family protein, partial [Lachnospiraceae bacterium]|nr:VanZ family protein [Lachnospiraceae bacterium]
LDEYHQSFVSGRGASVRDVMIDSIGVLPGIFLVRITGFIGRKTIFRPLALRKK